MEYLIGGVLGFVLANLVIIAFASYEKNFWGELKHHYKEHFTLLIAMPILEGASLLFDGDTFGIQILFFVLAFVFDKIVRSLMKKQKIKS